MSADTDAVAQARGTLRAHVALPPISAKEQFQWCEEYDRREAALIAAVRAECVDRVRGVPFRDSAKTMDFIVRATLELYRSDILAALEAP